MVPGPDKWIRSLKENPSGKVVADDGGINRWEWQSEDETARQLKKLSNDALTIEKADLRPAVKTGAKLARADKPLGHPIKPSRDAGGGFNPYDHNGSKPRKR
jgi:hypothetical protein